MANQPARTALASAGLGLLNPINPHETQVKEN
jgi:hypothetical protein